MVKVGFHISSEGSLEEVVSKVRGVYSAVQLFPNSPQEYFPKALSLGEEESLKSLASETTVIVHHNYLTNPSAQDSRQNLYAKSLKATCLFAEKIGASFVVVHPGSHKEHSLESALERLIVVIAESLACTRKVCICLENMSGGGTQVGADFKNLKKVCDHFSFSNPDRVGICFDTAHAFAAGYDVSSPSVVSDIRSLYGSYIKVLHLNNPDLKVKLGKHLDRHSSLLFSGVLSQEAMSDLSLAFSDVPQIMEGSPDPFADLCSFTSIRASRS